MRRFGEGPRRNHAGVDISAPRGTPIRASKAGTVVHSAWYYDYGYSVILDHGGGVASLYGHVSKLLVSEGRPVDKGDTIALVGCTGRCTGNHLHFEIRVGGRAVDPLGAGMMASGTSAPRRVAARTSRAAVAVAPQPASKSTTMRRYVKVVDNAVITTTDTLVDGKVVNRVEVTVFAQGQARVKVVREYRLVDGVMKLVKEYSRAHLVNDERNQDYEDDHG